MVNLCDGGFGNGFLDKAPKGQQKKTDHWTLTKLENISASRDTIKKVKIQPTEREKTFTNYISHKVLVSKNT